MAFRLRAPTAELLRKVAGRENLPQARVLEACLYRYAQDLQRGSSPAAATEKPNP